MQIGGTDIVIDTGAGRGKIVTSVLEAIERSWPLAVAEGLAGDRCSLSAFEPGESPEIFIYQNEDAALKWDKYGAEPELAISMIHAIIQDRRLTLVVGYTGDALVDKIIGAVRKSLRR